MKKTQINTAQHYSSPRPLRQESLGLWLTFLLESLKYCKKNYENSSYFNSAIT
jgi:hypothetical protein